MEKRQNSFDVLPLEMLLQILNVLDLKSLLAKKETCKRFHQLLEDNDWLWRRHCLQLRAVCPIEIDEDRKKGHTWQETVRINYKKCIIKQKWKDGVFSNIDSYEKLPPQTMCLLSVESWGEILDAELSRETQRHT
ncbi:F-box only protein 48 [Bufo bufo]|uniref:F-box only protein 48 n=1 Tax=Bufo bufo TaxID=8384 RepID=UPI001ABE5A43|nr:F-box only protein 48 [Bufo bufo]